MHVVFRTDASLQIGTGHVMRCLTLADAMRERGARCSFVCRPIHGHLLALVTQRGHKPMSLPEAQESPLLDRNGPAHAHWLSTGWATDAQDTQQMLKKLMGNTPVDWLVVDHYALDARWEEALGSHAKQIMVIDDLADRPHSCDLLLDQNLGRSSQDYEGLLKGKPITLIGPKYALLRPEFAALRQQSLARRQEKPQLRRMLVTMGGVDKDNATVQVLASLQRCPLPSDLNITVVLGPRSPWLAQVLKQAKQMPWCTEVLVGVDNMAQLMAESDFAIGAAGGSALERCCLGLPSFLLILAKNQLPGAIALQKVGAAIAMEMQQEIAVFVESLQPAISAVEIRIKMSKAGAAVADGEGCQRVVEQLLGYAYV